MTLEQAREAIARSRPHIGSAVELRIGRLDGEYVVIFPIAELPGHGFVIRDYHVNVFEDVQAAVAAPPIIDYGELVE